MRVSKTFAADIGHRLSCGYKGKCARLHGHRYTFDIWVEGSGLDTFGMVVDFNYMNAVGFWIDENLDHRTLLHKNDPLVEAYCAGTLSEETLSGEEVVVCDFNPTAENIGIYLVQHFRHEFPATVKIKKIVVWETPKCVADISNDDLLGTTLLNIIKLTRYKLLKG